MSKEYKVSYKVYFNERLKQVCFHGFFTHPLYVQVNFDRKSIFFKSFYFNLLYKEKFKRHFNLIFSVTSQDFNDFFIPLITDYETKVIEFIIEKTKNNFTLERFTKEYDYYTFDIFDNEESFFKRYVSMWLSSVQAHSFSMMVKATEDYTHSSFLIKDLGLLLKKDRLDDIFNFDSTYEPFYLLNEFLKSYRNEEYPLFLPRHEWISDEVKESFEKFLLSQNYNSHLINNRINSGRILH